MGIELPRFQRIGLVANFLDFVSENNSGCERLRFLTIIWVADSFDFQRISLVAKFLEV